MWRAAIHCMKTIVTSSAILDLINMYFDSSMTIIYYENGCKCKIEAIVVKIDFLRIFQQKENFWENLTCGCHGNTFDGVTSKSTNLVKITPLWFPWKPGHMTISIRFNKLDRGTF